MLVKEIMTTRVVTVKRTTPIKEIAQILVEHDVSGVPVVDESYHVVGMVSEGDLMQRETPPEIPDGLCILGAVIFYSGLKEYRDAFRKIWATTAEQIMTKEVISVREDDEVSKVAKILLEKKIKRVPVVNSEGVLAGIVSRRDIVKMLL